MSLPTWYHIVILPISFVITYILSKVVIYVCTRAGIVAVDVHKLNKPLIPTLGGLAILGGFLIPTSLLITSANYRLRSIVIISTALASSIIGLYDDFKALKGLTKALLTILLVIPIIIGHLLNPKIIPLGRPVVPIVGRLRLTIIYWLLLPLAIAGPANVINMLEVFNGVMPITTSLCLTSLTLVSLLRGKIEVLPFTLALLGSLLGYYPYNKYPSRLFTGNVGSLMVGSIIGCIAVMGGLEFVTLIALMPHLLNAFLVISSVKGLRERRTIGSRPIVIRNDGLLEANKDPKAPYTLTRLILFIAGPLTEKEIVTVLTWLEVVASILATVSGILYPPGV
ncbi:MAG: hypothetical protein B6U69_00175 [Thermofilum sp. ex4484_15]|nr:MAG: hypothetical protein B6U69_00175 [Thermofilum sp. ex4484_15]